MTTIPADPPGFALGFRRLNIKLPPEPRVRAAVA